MTPEQQAIAAEALIARLAPLIASVSHDVALVALLGMYRRTAVHFPCCIESAATNCAMVAGELVRRIHEQPPAGASLH